ncbi:MAG: DUF4956 domain-containing protein [Sedimentisphaerales bacterium]|nr:DUF4956 domain-containing protein [Sedimentisphaerales bacterium]
MNALKDALLKSLQADKFTPTEMIVAIGLSLIASIAVYIMYQVFYKSRNIGAGVDRCFLIIGPAITALFLGIQSSIPLSLGLLGALSFVRFRTPVKDPAEIGYLLLLIATSIGAATKTYLITLIVFIFVFIVLSIQWLIRNKFSFADRTNLIISVDKSVFQDMESKLTGFLQSRLNNLTLKTVSSLDNRISMHYQYQKTSASDRVKLTTELSQFAEPGNIEFFVG